MNKRHLIAPFVCIVLATISCNTQSEEGHLAPDPAAQGEQIVQLLQAENFEEVARLLHYPATYTPQERLADQAAVADSLRFLAGEVGHLDKVVVVREPVTFYKVSVSGGDVPYWQSLPNAGQDGALTYQAVFSKLGPGIFHLTFIRSGAGWQPRSIEVGLERGQPGAPERMADITRQMVARMASRRPKAL